MRCGAAERIEGEKKARSCTRIYSPGAKPPAERDVTFRTYDALITMQFSMDHGAARRGAARCITSDRRRHTAVIANVSNTSDKFRDKMRKRASRRSLARSLARSTRFLASCGQHGRTNGRWRFNTVIAHYCLAGVIATAAVGRRERGGREGRERDFSVYRVEEAR